MWTPTPVRKFVTIHPGVSFPRMRDFAHQAHQEFSRLVIFPFFHIFGGFLQLATAKAPRSIWRNMPEHVVPRKDVPFRRCDHKI